MHFPQYDTGIPASTGSSPSPSPSSSSSSRTKKTKSKKGSSSSSSISFSPLSANEIQRTPDLAAANEALQENRIKFEGKNLYSYKVINKQQQRGVVGTPVASFVQRKPGSVSSVVSVTPKPKVVVLSAPQHKGKLKPVIIPRAPQTRVTYGSYVRHPTPTAAPVSYGTPTRHHRHAASQLSVGYHRPSPYSHSPSPTPHSSYHSSRPSSSSSAYAPYGVSVAPTFARYPSSLTGNTLVCWGTNCFRKCRKHCNNINYICRSTVLL